MSLSHSPLVSTRSVSYITYHIRERSDMTGREERHIPTAYKTVLLKGNVHINIHSFCLPLTHKVLLDRSRQASLFTGRFLKMTLIQMVGRRWRALLFIYDNVVVIHSNVGLPTYTNGRVTNNARVGCSEFDHHSSRPTRYIETSSRTFIKTRARCKQ